MKKITTILFLIAALTSGLKAQIRVSGSNGADGVYTSLTNFRGAFYSINSDSQVGYDIVIEIFDNSTAESGFTALNDKGWNSLKIYPTVSGLEISGSANRPLIYFNGADNITIDGRVNESGSAPDLTIINTNTGNQAATFRFINSSENNKIRYCNIQGSGSSDQKGIIWFSTSTSGNGNDQNIIEFNNISSSTGGRPINAIYSEGSNNKDNSGIVIGNNNIFNFLNSDNASNGIYLGPYTSACTISGNSFYETSPLSPASPAEYTAIRIAGDGTGFSVTNNYIGGSAPSCGGTLWTKTNSNNNIFTAIYVSAGTGTATIVQNNTISKFAWSNSLNANWTGISVTGGDINIGTATGNKIGASSGTSSITLTNGSSSGSFYGMNLTGSGIINCSKNIIGAITTNNSSTSSSVSIYGISESVSAGTISITSNIIGNSTPNTIYASSPASTSAQVVVGINSSGTGAITINNNTVNNLTNGTTCGSIIYTGRTNGIYSSSGSGNTTISGNVITNLKIGNANAISNQNASVCGISLSGSAQKTVTGNSISGLVNTFGTFLGHVVGLYFTGSTGNNKISGNFIHSLSVNSSTASMDGIRIVAGSDTVSNNIIYLSGSNRTTIYGIYESGVSGNSNNFLFNTVYISGQSTAGSNNNSYALYSASNKANRSITDNLLVNERSTSGGSNQHYALYFAATGGTLTCDYNDYFVTGEGGALGYYGGVKTSLPIVTAMDLNSLSVEPLMFNPGGTSAIDYKPGVGMPGIYISGIPADYGGYLREIPPEMGAWGGVLNMWKGSVSTVWSVPDNWSRAMVPPADSDIYFSIHAIRPLIMDGDKSVKGIYNNQSIYRLVTNGYKLTVKGQFNFNNGAQVEASAQNSTVEFAGSTQQSIPAGSFFNNQVYNLLINNSNNVILNGTLNILNTITASSGVLDAYTASPTVIYGGISAQSILSGLFLDDRLYRLTIDNSAGVTLNCDFTINNTLTINSGKIFTIEAPWILTVPGTITNNAGITGLVIKSDGNGHDGRLINGTPSVPATVELFMSGGDAPLGPIFHYFVPPVASMTFDNSSITAAAASLGLTNFEGDLMNYSEPFAGDNQDNGWQYFDGYDWGFGPTTPFNTLQSTMGYNIGLTADDRMTFTGQLNAESHVFNNISFTNQGMNLIGNPYPCNYDITGIPELMGSNDGIDNTIYFNHDGGYAYYNPITGGTAGFTNIIAPMQGFFIEATATGSSVHLPANYKTTAAAGPLRSKGAVVTGSSEIKKIKLSLSDGKTSDETIVCLIDDATRNFDGDYDAHKLFSRKSKSSSIYTELNGVEYAINSVPSSGYIRIPVSVELKNSGNFAINVAEFENLEGYKVKLKHGAVETILQGNTTYTFTSGPGTFKDFELIIGDVFSKEGDKNTDGFTFTSWYRNNILYIKCPEELLSGLGSLRIYDIQGTMIYNDNQVYIVPGQIIQIPLHLTRGLYISNIMSNNKSFKMKILVF
jgi:hypothetical protein